ncbi:MAG TPA: hypothetical protein VHP83_08735, partial [Aggregatilineaceae bacterium]|nr:hypothetical protein [Aggregatilineaceae bacterium]
LMYIPFLVLLLVNPLLWEQGLFYKLTLLAQVAFYGCAGIGMALARKKVGQLKLFTLPFYFCMIYVAAAMATWNVIRGHRITSWQTQRREAA